MVYMEQKLKYVSKDKIKCINKSRREYEVPAENFKKNRIMHTVSLFPGRESCTCGGLWCSHMWAVVSKIIGEEVEWRNV